MDKFLSVRQKVTKIMTKKVQETKKHFLWMNHNKLEVS